jgi:hypothetical protein
MDSTPFKPALTAATTLNGAVTGSSAQITLPTPLATSPGGTGNPWQVRFANIGTQTIFWAWGNVTATAATSTPMLANSVEVFTCPEGITQVSVIAGGTGSTLYATAGMGV